MGRRGRGEGSVYQRKDGSWVAQFQGKYRYAQTEDAAKLKLYKMLTGAEWSKAKNITLSKPLDEYITHASTNLKPRTVKRYHGTISVHLKPAIGRLKLHSLDALTIEGMYARKLSDGVSPSTIQSIRAVLSSAIKRAVRLKLVQHNVCKGIETPSDHVERGNGSVWMFPNSVGKPMWRYSFMGFGWKPLLKRARGEYNRLPHR